jgi:hypothetical protein
MNIEDAVKQMNDINCDSEAAHGQADVILLEFLSSNGYSELYDAYTAAEDRNTFWYS